MKMKMNMDMWQKILEANSGAGSSPSPQLVKIITAAGLDKFINVKSKPSYNLILPTLAIALTKIDLEENKELKDIFFREFADLPLYQRERQAQSMLNPNLSYILGETAYYVENMIKTPNLYDVFLYRTQISQEKLNKAVEFILKEVLFNEMKKGFENDDSVFLDKIMSDETADQLLTLLELSEIKEETLKSLETVKAQSPFINSRLNKILGKNTDTSMLGVKSETVDIISIDISIDSLLAMERLDNLALTNAKNYISYIASQLIKLEKIDTPKYGLVKFIAYDKESHTEALTIINSLTQWVEQNKDVILKDIKKFSIEQSPPRDIEAAALKLSTKLSFLLL